MHPKARNRTTTNNPWFTYPRPNPSAKLRLFCLPYAGGGGHIYIPWKDHLKASVELCTIQLPGRGMRMIETPFTQVEALVETLTNAMLDQLNKPFAIFGHSMGALLAFEIAKKLRTMKRQPPLLVFASGRRAPQIPDTDPPTYHLPEPGFIQELKRLNGTPQEVLDNDELMQLLMPTLRADFELCETYRYQEDLPLSCPITVIGGNEDDNTDDASLAAWQQLTTGQFRMTKLAGDHFFLHSAQPDLLQIISQALEELLPDI